MHKSVTMGMSFFPWCIEFFYQLTSCTWLSSCLLRVISHSTQQGLSCPYGHNFIKTWKDILPMKKTHIYENTLWHFFYIFTFQNQGSNSLLWTRYSQSVSKVELHIIFLSLKNWSKVAKNRTQVSGLLVK